MKQKLEYTEDLASKKRKRNLNKFMDPILIIRGGDQLSIIGLVSTDSEVEMLISELPYKEEIRILHLRCKHDSNRKFFAMILQDFEDENSYPQIYHARFIDESENDKALFENLKNQHLENYISNAVFENRDEAVRIHDRMFCFAYDVFTSEHLKAQIKIVKRIEKAVMVEDFLGSKHPMIDSLWKDQNGSVYRVTGYTQQKNSGEIMISYHDEEEHSKIPTSILYSKWNGKYIPIE